MKKQKSPQAQAATMIRKHLKKNGIKAKVTSRSASMMSAVDITTEDLLPATEKLISDYVNQFKSGNFDGMTDCYEYSNSRSDIPQVKYVIFVNEFSDELKQAAWNWTRETFGGLEERPALINDIRDYDDQRILQRTLNDSTAGFWNTFKCKKTIKILAA